MGVVRIVDQVFRVEKVDEIRPSHGPARVAAVGGLRHGCGEPADVVGAAAQEFEIEFHGESNL